MDNVDKCQQLTKTNLFRPPYGRIKKSQFKILSNDYKIVFWDVLSYDYDKLVTPKKCLDNSIKYTRNGSIIVFHDNIKAQNNLKFALPHYIEHFLKLNYKFATL
jgi:peptidoglycan/xylan/chitin deacetylase (PgdA/CDA1 family)